MIAGTVLVLFLAATALAFVVTPLLRAGRSNATADDSASVALLRELHARHQMLLGGLKDLEDDRATDKIGDEDYEQLKRRLSTQAIEVMRRLDAAEHEREQELEREREASRPLRYPGTGRSDPSP